MLWIKSISFRKTLTVSALDLCLLVGIGVLLLVERELLTATAALRGEQVGKGGMFQWLGPSAW